MSTEVDKDKPLLPRTASSATLVVVPLAAILGGLGWAGQKILAIDEQLVRAQQELDSRGTRFEQAAADITMLREEVRTLDAQAAAQTAEQENIRNLGAKIDERLVRNETLVEVLMLEQQNIRATLKGLGVFTNTRGAKQP